MAAGRGGGCWRGGVGTRSPPPRDAGRRTREQEQTCQEKEPGHYHVCGLVDPCSAPAARKAASSSRVASQHAIANQASNIIMLQCLVIGNSNLYCNTNKTKSHTIEVLVIIRSAD
jgi:hypothetical protein